MAVVIASNLRKELAGDPLFDGVSFKVERRDRVALAGPNGAGKTTLLRALAGETSLQGGDLAFQKGTRVALHDQRPPLQRGLSLREYVLGGAADLVALEDELRRLEGAMAAGDHGDATLRRYAEAQTRLEHAGGYAWRDHAAAVVRGLGFTDADFERQLDTFSGGELTRASLARALGGDPDLLLLDEPTNHLDVESLEWLERELASLDTGVIVVAHDRWFLEAVTNAVLELEGGRSLYFAGPWHAWRREKAERAQHLAKTAQRVEVDIARLERFVERFRYKKSKAKQAQAKLTHIARLEKERAGARGELGRLTLKKRGLGFEFLKPARSGRTVVEAESLDVAIGDRALVSGATFAVERGEHLALIGPNGSGKTTVLETILGRREPSAGSPTTGVTSQPSRHISARAPSCRLCCSAGRRCSSERRADERGRQERRNDAADLRCRHAGLDRRRRVDRGGDRVGARTRDQLVHRALVLLRRQRRLPRRQLSDRRLLADAGTHATTTDRRRPVRAPVDVARRHPHWRRRRFRHREAVLRSSPYFSANVAIRASATTRSGRPDT